MMRHLFRRHLRDQLSIFVLFGAITFLLTLLLVWIFPTITRIKNLQKILESLPLFIKAMLGKEMLSITTFEGFMGMRYFNTALVWVFSIFTILYCSTMISADMASQRIEIVLSQPINRFEVILSRFASYVVYLICLIIIACGGLWVGIQWIGITTDFVLIFKIFLSLFAMEIAVGGICLLLSCLLDDPLKATFYSLGLFILFYFLKIFLALTPSLSFLRKFNIFTYFDATTIIKSQSLGLSNLAVLLGVAIFFLMASLIYFQKKEIYVT